MSYFNLHTHCHYCDGKEPPENYIKRALELEFHTLGFSSHAPVPFENKFAIKEDSLKAYFKEIRDLQKKYKSRIRLHLALEMDYIPGITTSFNAFREAGDLDYAIGGVHLIRNRERDNKGLWFIDGPYYERYDEGFEKLYDKNPRKGVTAYYNQIMEMVATEKPDIIAHLDKIKMHNRDRYFTESEAWYKDLVWKTLKFISKESDCIIEVNTRGIYKKRCDSLFPGPHILEQVHHLNIPVTLSSDAHKSDELDGEYSSTLNMLKEIGFRELVYFDGRKRKAQTFLSC